MTTHTTDTNGEIASRYAGCWSIEVTFRDAKQHLRGAAPPVLARRGPERAAARSLWLHTTI